MEINELRVDPEKINEGVWRDIGNGSRLRIARYDNIKMLRLQTRLVDEFRERDGGSLDDKASAEVVNRILAETILVDWEGLTENGEHLPYSKEKAYEILSNPHFVDFRDKIIMLSQQQSHYAYVAEKDDVKK